MENRRVTLLGRMLAGALVLVLGAGAVGCGSGATSSQGSASSNPTLASSIGVPDVTAEIADITSVAYLGPAGTYTEEATKLFFGDNDELLAQETVADALALVGEGKAAYAVIPQENTLGGPVTDYIDALLAVDGVSVVGEVVLPIRQTLMGLPGTDLSQVTKVLSHKQGLAQSAAWLDEHLQGVAREERASTAAAASEVAEGGDATVVAIAAPGAAELYGLEVLQDNVSQSEANKTRFYVVSSTPNELEGYDCATLVASVSADELPGVLEEACSDGTKLVCVHDRPEGSALGSYRYVIELTREDGFTDAELERLEGIEGVSVLGSFRRVEG